MHVAALLDASSQDADRLVELAVSASANGIRDVIVSDTRTGAGHPQTHADAWTVAAWIAARIDGLRVAVDQDEPHPADPADPERPFAAVLDKARSSLDLLIPGRGLPSGAEWVVAPEHPDAQTLLRLAESGMPAVPVSDPADLAELGDVLATLPAAAGSGVDELADAELPASLAQRAVRPGDADYGSVSSTYLRGGAPGLVLRPRDPGEVADALAFARAHREVPFGIRSAGHGISGRSTNRGGLVIDVGAMNGIEILDAHARAVRIGPGATWKQVAQRLVPHGLALGSGDYGGVGVGGLATAGGIGLLSRKHGLTIDHLRAVELVLADGTPVRASATENPELFWAVRGAGANFGIATAFEFEASQVGQLGWAQLVLVTDDIETSLRRYGEIATAAPRDTTVFLVTGRDRGGQWGVQLYGVVDNPDPDVVIERLTPFLELGALASQQVVMTSYDGVMANAAEVGPEGQQGFGDPLSRSAFLPELTPEFARDAASLLSGDLVYFFELRPMGGAIGDVPAEAMAFSHRAPRFQLTAMSSSDDRLSKRWDALRGHFDGLYLSFETDRRPERLLDAFPEPVLGRLRQLKARYDPENLFRDNFNIAPASPSGAQDETSTAGAAR